ncbi:PfkB family carbohydrate kinase [Luteimicrobium album]|uniref:PfkB family carbohydrate kinase n=1 Tax=Luteimicrobium album TaxID=1054550 RepID=UPI0024E0F25E|nr:PfkB family carbohydrate kinase [Luteimicrobium album]
MTRSTVMTLGGEATLVAAGDDVVEVPVVPVAPVDTTGAGDCFAGTVASRLAAGATLADAVRAGNETASALIAVPRSER